MSMKSLLWKAMFVAALGLAGFLLYRIFHQYSANQILESFARIPAYNLLLAALAAAGSYLCITGFDFLAIRSIGKKIAYRRIALASFVSLSLGHNIGFAGLSSGAFRYRFYSRWGLSTEDVAKIILFCGVTVGMGLVGLGGMALIVNPADAAALLGLSEASARVAGLGLLLVPMAYVALAALVRARLHLWRWSLQLPSPGIAILQVAVGTLNFAFVSACLHALLAAFGNVAFLQSVTAFVLANSAVLATHVPGGLGVLETTVQHVVPDAASIGALIAFRAIYFVLPLILGTGLLFICEFIPGRSRPGKEPQAGKPAQASSA